ncbi:MAG: AgmX/PglI C-terminal domain-containing protein [Bacteriovoracales bacterium]|nr:AgmX/PglI C-terminal domain-containing protein [Bacteriovoracales bacterium]
MVRQVVLENIEGETIRFFAWEGESASLIFREDRKRLEFSRDLADLRKNKLPFRKLAEVNYSELAQKAFPIEGLGWLKAINRVENVLFDKSSLREPLPNAPWGILVFVSLLIFSLIGGLAKFFPKEVKLEDQLKQHVVKIVKRAPKPPPKPKKRQVVKQTETKTKTKASKKTVKRMGALAVLGKMGKKSSKLVGGLNLGALKTSAGPGLGGGTKGSGGMQTSLYGKGLIAAPVGPGANIKGGGGYGTKGKGGGKDGYGRTSLIGSSGTSLVPLGREAIIEGGLDQETIARVIQKNMGQVRFCYEMGLQSNPKLSGRVAVRFIIGGNGNVKTASLENSSLKSKVVENCILMRIKTWKFPAPDGGVDVNVAYPFLLRRMGAG